jgi:hypothetical protein
MRAEIQAAHEAKNRRLRIMPNWDELPNITRAIAKLVFSSEVADASTLALIRSMLPRYMEATGNGARMEIAPIIDRIKHRRKIAELHGRTLAVFENDRIDESTKADDLALLAALPKGAGQKPPRTDKGKPHRKRKTISGAWRSAADVADDFNRAFKPCEIEQGVPKIGNCNEAKINQWDAKYPDAKHKNRWGYHAGLRINADLKSEYLNVVAGWGEYWSDYKAQFVKWRKTHKNSPRSDFRFKPMTRTDIDPERIGVDAGGKKYVRSMSDDEIRAGGK